MTDINDKLTDNLNIRLSALDKNLKDSFYSVKKDIVNLRRGYDAQIKSIVSELSALNQMAENIKGEAARQAQLSLVESKVARLEQQEKAIEKLESRLAAEEAAIKQLWGTRDISILRKRVDSLSESAASKQELSRELASITGRMDRLSSVSSLEKIEKKLSELRKGIDDAKRGLVPKSQYNEEIEGISQTISRLAERQELANAEKRIASAEKSLAESKKRMVTKSSFYDEIYYFDQQNEALSKKMAELEYLKSEAAALSAGAKKTAKDVSALRKRNVSHSDFKNGVKNLSSRIDRLKSESDASYAKVEQEAGLLRASAASKDELSHSIYEIQKELEEQEQSANSSAQSLLRRIDALAKSAVKNPVFSKKTKALSEQLAKASRESQARAALLERKLSALEGRALKASEFSSKIAAISARIGGLEEEEIESEELLRKSLDSLRKSSVSGRELARKITSVNQKIGSAVAGLRDSDAEIRKSISEFEKQAVTSDALSGRSAELRNEMRVIRNKTAGLSKDVEKLAATKTNEANFREEYSYVERKLLDAEKRISAVEKLKSEIAGLRRAEARLALLEKHSATKQALGRISGNISRKIRTVEREFDDVASAVRNSHDELSAFKEQAVTRDTFEFEIGKCDLRARRSVSEAKKAKDSITAFEERMQSDYATRAALSNSIRGIRQSIAAVGRRADETSKIPELYAKIESLERELARQKSAQRRLVTRDEFYSNANSIKSRYYELKRILQQKINELSRGIRRERVSYEEVKSIEIAPKREAPAPAVRREKPKQKGRGFFSVLARIVHDFFTVEEEEAAERKQREAPKPKVKEKKEKRGSRLIYLIVIFLVIFALAVLILFNYKTIVGFFNSTRQAGMNVSIAKNATSIAKNASVVKNATSNVSVAKNATTIVKNVTNITKNATNATNQTSWIAGAGRKAGSWLSSAWAWIKEVAISVGSAVASAATSVWAFILDYLWYIIAGIVIVVAVIVLSAGNIALKLWNGIKKGFAWIGKTFMNFFTEEVPKNSRKSRNSRNGAGKRK